MYAIRSYYDHDLLARQLGEHGAVEPGLRGFDRDLAAAATGELGQERVARRALVNDCRVAEADVHRGRAVDAVERAVERLEAIGA